MRNCLSSNCPSIYAAVFIAVVTPLCMLPGLAQMPVALPKVDAIAITPPLFVVHFTPGPGWAHDKSVNEQPGMKAHLGNLAQLRAVGKLLTGARYKDSHADKGMIILKVTNRAEVEAELASDPMLAGKIFVADIAEFWPFCDGFVSRTGRGAILKNNRLHSSDLAYGSSSATNSFSASAS